MRRYVFLALAIVLNSIGHSMTIVTNLGSMPWPASIVNIMEPGMTVSLDHLKGIYHHNVLEMTRLGDLLPQLYREVVEGKKVQ